MTTFEPAVWLGCLHCYNSGKLIGEWVTDAEDLNMEYIHGDTITAFCEELHCFDSSCMPGGEMGPIAAAEWFEFFAGIGESERKAALAFVDLFGYKTPPSPTDFEDSFRGEWESFKDYLWEFVTGSMGLDTETFPGNYFNMDSFAEDMRHDYSVVRTSNGVFVFSDY